MPNGAFGDATLVRIERLIVVLGVVGTIWAVWHWGWLGGAGLAAGALLSWINFRWLKGGVRAFSGTDAEQGAAKTQRAPLSAFGKFFGRFVLLVGALYVILSYSPLLAIAVFTGLFASAAAVVVGLVYELVFASVRPGAGKGS